MINERKLSKDELNKREDIIKNMKDNKRDLVKKYGKDAEAVMYGRATNMAKKQTKEMRDPKITELIKNALRNPKASPKKDKVKEFEYKSLKDFKDAISETTDWEAWTKLDRLRNAINDDDYIIQSLMKAMSTDDANLYLDAMIRDHIDIMQGEEGIEEGKDGFVSSVKSSMKKADPKASLKSIKELNQRSKDLIDGYELEDLERAYEDILRDMEQEAEPEGGPIADQYADELHAYEDAIRFIKNKGKEKAQMTYDQAIGRDTVTADRDAFERSSKFKKTGERSGFDMRGIKEDLDLGHEDNEPNMIKAELYHIGKCAMKLYSILDKFDDGGEVDLPSWWQSKISKSKEALVGAEQYLDFELNEPKIDAVVDVATDVVNDVDVEVVDSVDIDETVEDYITSVDDVSEGNGIHKAFEPWGKMLKKKTAENVANKIRKTIDNAIEPDDIDESRDWIQKAIKRPGALHRALDIPQDKDIPKSLINKDIKKMDDLEDKEGHLDKKDLRFLRQLDLAKTLEKFNENEIREALPKGFWDKKMDAEDEDQDGKVDESFDSLTKKLDKQKGVDKEYAGKIAGKIANLKRKGAGKGPTAKQKKQMDEDYDSLVNKIKKQGKSAKAAKAIAGAVASYKAKGGGKGPTAKQK
jgi:hypothetical protein